MSEHWRNLSTSDSEAPPSPAVPPASGRWPASLAPGAALLRQVGRLTLEPRYDCLLVGLAGSGKTSLLAGLGRAGDLGMGIQIVPGRALAELAARVLDREGDGLTPPLPAAEPWRGDFQVQIEPGAAGAGAPARRFELEIAVQEWPARALLPSRGGNGRPQQQAGVSPRGWLAAAREAVCLVLCVDAMSDASLWQAAMPRLVSRLAVSAGYLVPRLAAEERDGVAAELPPVASPRRQLPFIRVLLMLTKIDRLCAAVMRTGAAGPIGVGSSRDLARRLDPLGLALDRLGEVPLAQLASALRPGARLAVGCFGSRGFATGGASEGPQSGGAPAGLAELEPAWAGRPFGLREAVVFLATGHSSHPVEEIGEIAAAADHGRWIEITRR